MENRQTGRRSLRRAVRIALALAVAGLCLWQAMRQMNDVTPAALMQAMGAIPLTGWLGAVLATVASYAAIAHYDVIAHRHLRTGLAASAAARAGAAAVAVSQLLGLGLATGAVARWRLVPALGLRGATALTALVSMSFMTALGALIVLFNPLHDHLVSALGLALMVLLAAALLRRPVLKLGSRRIALPSLPAAAAFFTLTLADTALAAAALACLLPDVALSALLPVYLLALGAGLLGGTPGGIGPFELTLALLLPQVPADSLAAALLGYRIVYHALPAALAAQAFLSPSTVPLLPPQDDLPPAQGLRAEHIAALQNGAEGLAAGPSRGAVLSGPQSLTLFLGPADGPLPPLLRALKARARASNRVACAYKLTPRDAALARRAGWRTLPIARDAVIDPRRFDLHAPSARQLRRMLRKAARSGLRTETITLPDWPAMARVNAAWAQAHGGENGLTMGRFERGYLSGQKLYGAWRGSQLIAFLSVMPHPQEPTVDLMRCLPGHPPGTMQALVLAALRDAARNGACLNLAAVPAPWLLRLSRRHQGLARFKAGFDPCWRPLFIAAPSWPALALAGWDLWRGIHHPPDLTVAHHDHEDFVFEPAHQPCQTGARTQTHQAG
ncbi:MAG: DUF2156 domain-containing protein [Roseivivax sp.]|nr:DUF2156 domain-containing protein [Roseivivax sp.]